MLALASVRGKKVHVPKGVVGRRMPTPGQQTVWPALCGARIFAHAVDTTTADAAELLCERCRAAVLSTTRCPSSSTPP